MSNTGTLAPAEVRANVFTFAAGSGIIPGSGPPHRAAPQRNQDTMTDLSIQAAHSGQHAARRLRFVTAASLFDGHDASINIIRRMLMASGAEVIHLGHNRSVEEIVTAALQEDAHGIAVSSYQGGHVEYFRYMIDLLRERGGANIKVFGGGGGVIVPAEIRELHDYGVARIYSPEDGARMGLQGMIDDMLAQANQDLCADLPASLDALMAGDRRALARVITALEGAVMPEVAHKALLAHAQQRSGVPVLGITGTGGSGKSSLTDELVRRFRLDQGDRLKIALIAVDPSRRKTGGALLGDRIRMNAINAATIYMRSLATRSVGSEIAACLPDVIAACKCAGFDLVMVETSGIGQGDAAIVPHADLSLYVMTPEYGAASQLEKIDMLDFADCVAINKFDRRGAEDAQRDVSKQFQRNRQAFSSAPDQMPVFGTIASRFNDDGVTALYQALAARLKDKGLKLQKGTLAPVEVRASSRVTAVVPPARVRYLAEIAQAVRQYKEHALEQSRIARERQQLTEAKRMLAASLGPSLSPSSRRAPGSSEDLSLDSGLRRNDDLSSAPAGQPIRAAAVAAKTNRQVTSKAAGRGEGDKAPSPLAGEGRGEGALASQLDALIAARDARLDPRARKLLDMWPAMQQAYAGAEYVVKIRDREIRTQLTYTTLSGTAVRKVALPRFQDHGEILQWLMLENVPGSFPYTAGVFAFKRENEDPTRMFAGEGDPFRTNRRFHLLSKDMPAKRLSTAFDSVTLYGFDPDLRPDIYGKVGNSGVSIATLDDMKVLYSGFDLTDPSTSVSMTINGPAPTILAMFMNTAIDQQLDKFRTDNGREPTEDEAEKIREWTLETARGTVQADILKEDQGQNTCIFSTEFSLKVMGDIQDYFIHHNVRNFYSVSISGYHIAEAGANPISQLAFTLSNGFTFVEAYLARGMHIDDFAPNLSFFFSNGMDPEYSVLAGWRAASGP